MIVEAGDRARWLAFLHGAINSNMAVAGGWMERAASLLEDAEECSGHGWLVLDRAPFTDDAEERHRPATAALAIARAKRWHGPRACSNSRVAATPRPASVEAKDLLERRGPGIGHALLEEF